MPLRLAVRLSRRAPAHSILCTLPAPSGPQRWANAAEFSTLTVSPKSPQAPCCMSACHVGTARISVVQSRARRMHRTRAARTTRTSSECCSVRSDHPSACPCLLPLLLGHTLVRAYSAALCRASSSKKTRRGLGLAHRTHTRRGGIGHSQWSRRSPCPGACRPSTKGRTLRRSGLRKAERGML